MPRGRRILAKRYALLEEVGAGGTGTVHRARDLRSREIVAVKLLHASLTSNPAFAQRFRREASIAKDIASPHIARVIDFGSDDGTPFIVMEFVEGMTLQQLLAENGPLQPEQALSIMAQVAAALRDAHAKGIVHRDIKPSNIKVLRDGSVKVLDFGIAKVEDGATITLAGAVFGSVHYIAPEQTQGQEDARSDIYSLGVVVYELLTGHPPFHAESPWAIVRMHLEAEPAPLSVARPDIPASVVAVVERCLSKNPGERCQTPEELRLGILAILPSAVATGFRLRRPSRRASRLIRSGFLRLRLSRPPIMGASLSLNVAILAGAILFAFCTSPSPSSSGKDVVDRRENQAAEAANFRLYSAKAGDSAAMIALRSGISLDTLRAANPDMEENLLEGQMLIIPLSEGVLHFVQRGDTVESIASRYGASPYAILGWPSNNLDAVDQHLNTDQVIFVPGPLTSATKTATSMPTRPPSTASGPTAPSPSTPTFRPIPPGLPTVRPTPTSSPMDDNFNDNSINATLWDIVTRPGSASVNETNRRLEMTIPAEDSSAGAQTRCSVAGDFDVVVDFSLLLWPPLTFDAVYLVAMDLPFVGVFRLSYQSEIYQFRSTAPYAEASATGLTGRLRLTREGNVITGHYWNGSSFVAIGSAANSLTGPTRLALVLDHPDIVPDTAQLAGVDIAFDNFRVLQGVVTCPSAIADLQHANLTQQQYFHDRA